VKCWHRLRIRGKWHVCRTCGIEIEQCPCVEWQRNPRPDCTLCAGSGWIATTRSERDRFLDYVERQERVVVTVPQASPAAPERAATPVQRETPKTPSKAPPIIWPEQSQRDRPKELSQLYPKGTPLSEVHPDFVGMNPKLWHSLKIREQSSERVRAFFAQFLNGVPDEETRTMGKRIATPRDSYGWRS
jgi:hypothetical protein